MRNICPSACFCCVRVACVVSVQPTVTPVVILLLCLIRCPLWFFLLSRPYSCPVLLVFTLMGWVYATTFRLHILACKAQIWSLWCINCVDMLPFVIVRSVKSEFLAVVADAKFINASSISTCLTLLEFHSLLI